MTLNELKAEADRIAATLPGETNIAGYKVTLEAMIDSSDPDRGVWIHCDVQGKQRGSSNTLGCLEGEGAFDDTGEEISEAALDRIREFACRYGY